MAAPIHDEGILSGFRMCEEHGAEILLQSLKSKTFYLVVVEDQLLPKITPLDEIELLIGGVYTIVPSDEEGIAFKIKFNENHPKTLEIKDTPYEPIDMNLAFNLIDWQYEYQGEMQ